MLHSKFIIIIMYFWQFLWDQKNVSFLTRSSNTHVPEGKVDYVLQNNLCQSAAIPFCSPMVGQLQWQTWMTVYDSTESGRTVNEIFTWPAGWNLETPVTVTGLVTRCILCLVLPSPYVPPHSYVFQYMTIYICSPQYWCSPKFYP